MTTALAIAAAVLAVSLLIVVHEAGHQAAARFSRMAVERFSVGFGPVLLAFRRGGTEYAISALPLGGYVKIRGMATGEDIAPDDPTAYCNQPAWRRFLVIVAGPAMNYLAAVAIAAALLTTVGLQFPDAAARVGDVVPDRPAAEAGLRKGDRIVAVDGAPASTFEDVVRGLVANPSRTIPVEVERGADRLTLSVTPDANGQIGVARAMRVERRPALEVIPAAFGFTNAAFGQQLAGFGQVFSSSGGVKRLSGPLGIGESLVAGAQKGVGDFFQLVWIISIALALLNLLPIPALDGGRLVFLGYEMITRRRVSEKVEGIVHFAGFVVLIGLLLGVTIFGDLARLLAR